MAARGSATTTTKGGASVFKLEGEAQTLADRLPDLLLDALRVANTVVHGIHGRRRAGTGETFWQFRQFQSGSDPATVIDWRRSASSDTLYVREREWEASHTFWLWPDVSPSMAFQKPPGARHQARPRAGADAGHRRDAGARRRAHRAAGPDAADGQPQGHLAPRRDPGRQ